MSENFKSEIFGEIRTASDQEAELIAQLVNDVPAAVFGALNRRLNGRGYMASLVDLSELNKLKAN